MPRGSGKLLALGGVRYASAVGTSLASRGRRPYSRLPGSRLEVLKMCEDCRVAAVTTAGFDPYAAAERPRPRTSDDYLREREGKS